MAPTLLVVALAVAVVSAIRGIWSPCGLSMLSSITPMTEAGRGHRFGVTAGWFVIGGVVGGASIGLVAALGAAGLAAASIAPTTRLAIGVLVAATTAAVDLGVAGIDLPIFKRQVDDAWLRRYRGWAYGAGFGWQIGFGVATYIMTAGIFLMIALAVLTASPLAALAIGTTFGLVRGAAVYVGRSATSPAALAAVHRRLDDLAPLARLAAAWVQIAAVPALAFAVWPPLAAGALAAVAVVLAARSLRTWGHGSPARAA